MNSIRQTLLFARSDFSLGESTLQIPKLVARAKSLNYSAVALTDYMTISGMVAFTAECRKAGIKPIIGATLRVYDDPSYKKTGKGAGERRNRFFNLKAIVLNDRGLRSLLGVLSKGYTNEYHYYHPRVGLDEVLTLEGCVILTGDFQNLFHHPNAREILGKISARLPTYVEIVPIDTPLYGTLNKKAIEAAYAHDVGTILSYPALYETPEVASSLSVIKAISVNGKMTDPWLSHQFVTDLAPTSFREIVERMARCRDKYSLPMSNLDIKNAATAGENIASLVTYEFKKLDPCLPKMAENEFAELVSLCKKGWAERLSREVMGYKPSDDPAVRTQYAERLKYELAVIKKMNFAGYFLLVSEIVSWAKKQGVMVGPGRGSVGGSLVAYLIQITDVDPIRFNLLFERFINPDRVDLPDADLDFMSLRRHSVIDYIVKRWGADYVAGISNYSTLGAASAIRDSGRVHGLSPFELSCSKLVEKQHGVSLDLETSCAKVPEIERFSKEHPVIWNHARNLEGAMRGLSQHAAGVVVAGEPLVNRAVIESRSGGNVVNWDKKSVEDWGLIKMDILGLSTLDTLSMAASYIRERHGLNIDFLSLPIDDAAVLMKFAKGETAGIFQFESAGMRNILKRLSEGGPLSFEDLVTTTALFRPGPLDAGLCEQYIAIKQGTQPTTYEHPNMKASLSSTSGVIVYQEQVMQVCRDLAGFSMTEADHVRRAMGKKDIEKMKKWREQFIAGAYRVSGMNEHVATMLWDKIESFAGYAFNRSHSVAYSIISWWGMWLKTHYPAEFYAASLTMLSASNASTAEDRMLNLVNDAIAHGIKVMPPDINISTDIVEIRDSVIYAPFQAVKGISESSARAIADLRDDIGGSFTSKSHFELEITNAAMGQKCNSTNRSRLERVGAFVSTDGGPAALDPSRLKDRLELIGGFTTDSVKTDRKLDSSRLAVLEVVRLHQVFEDCQGCSLKGKPHPNPAMGKTMRFMAIFDCPSWQDERSGKMLSGDMGKVLKTALKSSGLSPNDGYYTSLVKSQKTGKTLSNEQINGCVEHLKKEIEILKPGVILALGSNTIRFLVPGFKGNPTDLAGKVYFDPHLDASIVLGINPAQVLFDNKKLSLLETACNKVKELIK